MGFSQKWMFWYFITFYLSMYKSIYCNALPQFKTSPFVQEILEVNACCVQLRMGDKSCFGILNKSMQE